MAKVLQLRHGTTAEHESFTGTLAEVTVDTDLKTLRVHDGTTAGGHVLSRKTDVDTAISALQTQVNGKAASSHSHAMSDVSGLSDAISSAAANAVPPGTIITFGGRTIPSGYLLCNGAAVSRTQYPNLFAAIGTIYGSGNGSTTFNLPNDHHRVDEGTTSASEVGTKVEAGAPNITGTFDNNGNATEASTTGSGAFTATNDARTSNSGWSKQGGYYSFNAGSANGIYGKSSTIQPQSYRRYHLIKW